MNRLEFYSNLDQYKDYLEHIASPLYGQQRQNTKYYKREGKPGSYRYYYSKAEWDAAHKPTAVGKGSSGDFNGEAYQKYLNEQKAKKQREENIAKNVGYAQNAEKAKGERMKETADKRTALEKAQYARYKEESQARLRAQKEAAIEAAEKERLAKLEDERRKNEAAAKNAEAERWNKVTEENARLKAEKEAAEAELARIEAEKSAQTAEEEKKAQIQANTNYMLNDESSPFRWCNDIQEYSLNGYQGPDMDNAIDEVYHKIANYKETEETDPETGLKIKNYSLPIEEDIKMVNPGVWYSDSRAMDYGTNCYACTTTMALREMGYDVTAGPDLRDYGILSEGTDPEVGMAYDDLWSGHFTEVKQAYETMSNITKEPANSFGDFNFTYYDSSGWPCGHSIFYKVDNSGTVHYYDTQLGMEITDFSMYGELYSARYKRLDDKEFLGLENMKKSNKVGQVNIENVKGAKK